MLPFEAAGKLSLRGEYLSAKKEGERKGGHAWHDLRHSMGKECADRMLLFRIPETETLCLMVRLVRTVMGSLVTSSPVDNKARGCSQNDKSGNDDQNECGGRTGWLGWSLCNDRG